MIMCRDDLLASIVKIMHNGKTKGTGFVVAQGLIATCAHVVLDAGAESGTAVDVQFLVDNSRTLQARVEPEFWRDESNGDAAILRLESRMPSSVKRVTLGPSNGLAGRLLVGLGFPEGEGRTGLWHEALVIGFLGSERRLQLRCPEVSPGSSGSPLLDERLGLVVGMVQAIRPMDELGRHAATAFANIAETLVEICPTLSLHTLPMTTAPSRAAVRQFISAILRSDSDFDTFCMDYFASVYVRFSNGMDRVRKVNILLEHVNPTTQIVEALRLAHPESSREYDHLIGRQMQIPNNDR